MHQFRSFSLLLLYATESASLVLFHMLRSNAINHGTPQIIQPANLIQPQNRTGLFTWGDYYDIGSNLTIYIILGDTAPVQPVHELLILAKEQVHDSAALFGPVTPVPHRKKTRDLTHIDRAGLTYFIEPVPAFVRERPGLEWGEFEVVTSWLYEHFVVLLNHRECNFVLFRRLSVTTGQEANLAFGGIKPLNSTMVVKTTLNGTTRLPAELVSPGSIDAS